jgi:hypothetical protein
MPQTSLEAAPRSNYQLIFDNALEAYRRKTRNDLKKDPLLCRLETCQSPDAVLTLLRAQLLGPGESQSSGDRLTSWLDPTVNVINVFSATIGGGVALVSLMTSDQLLVSPLIFILEACPPAGVIFTGIGVLLSVSISIDIFSVIVT